MEIMLQTVAGPTSYGLRGRKVVQNLSRPFDEGFGTDEEPPESYKTPDPAPPPWQPPRVTEKSVPLTIFLALVVPGLGHIYGRRYAQGIAILFIIIVLLLLYIFIFTIVAAVLIWGWQVYDAYRNIRRYNQLVFETGARPW
jgi:TM2 domain-containing membrane protein YozV